uniref:Malate dehydrogenase, cytoplasmic n=1 Tax=Meloidogyne incognita TaxID=6306 RepID=A0A914NMQ7_MELIC
MDTPNLKFCYNKGCGAKFNPDENKEDSCTFHPGPPYFHDAYKIWKCCNKKSTDFTAWLNFEGCTRGPHNPVKPDVPKIQQTQPKAEEKIPIRVLVTGAAGQIGYSLVIQIAKGDVFGKETPIVLVMLDIPPLGEVLKGVELELYDCALANLIAVEPVTTEEAAFKDIDYAFLVGAMPRKEGMERKDLLAANVKIFKSQGLALAKYSKPTVKVLVVGNPANTNAFICAKYAAEKIPTKNFSAMTRLDHNRAIAQIAARCGVDCGSVKKVIIWGNHSSTQFPDVKHAKVIKGGTEIGAYEAVNDVPWIQNEFISTVQKRGAVIIEKRKLSSAMSAAKAACDHIHDWHFGTKPGDWVSMAVPSDGSYGIPKGLVFSFPITIDAKTRNWKIVQGLELDDFTKQKIEITTEPKVFLNLFLMDSSNLLLCYNKGCGAKFNPAENKEDSCIFHPGPPYFHDAYKIWKCCNKKSTDFSTWLSFEGCTRGPHNPDKPCNDVPKVLLSQPEVDEK